MKRVKVGVIGAGRAGMMHIENILTLNTIELVAVADVLIENVQEILNDAGIEQTFKDYHELLALPQIEAVFIFTSTDTHEAICLAAAHAKKHIFCEKPLSMTGQEADSLKAMQSVKENDVRMAIGFNRRLDHQFRTIWEKVENGEVGEPQIVKITSRDPDLLPHALIQRIGGLIFDFTMHDFDMARYMMHSNVTEVFAKGATLIDPTLSEINDIDTLALVLKFENGGFALIDNSRRAVYGYDQRVEVFGSKGMLKAENVSNSTVEHYTSKATVLDKPLPIFNERYQQAYRQEIIDFVSNLMTGQPFAATPLDVVMAQRVAMAAITSIQTGEAVPVNPEEPIV